jgi:RHS repeat-associated protein
LQHTLRSGQAGQRLDSTGLYYYGARYYDPIIGRFISADTIVPSPANPQSLNRYSYCLNNPLKYVDPTGHDSYAMDEGMNDDGEYWYCVYSDPDYTNLVGIVTGGDNLFDKFSDIQGFDIDKESLTSQSKTPAYQNAQAMANVVGERTEDIFFGSSYGISKETVISHAIAQGNLTLPSGLLSALTLVTTGMSGDIKQPGSYIIAFENGKGYIGKGPLSRAYESASDLGYYNNTKALTIQWDGAVSNRQAFIDEYLKMK